ncbi:MAG TPA: DUF1549 and DUF1553 domain-containing protein [Pirellulales bacterium]|nr:DUF1549 and DUF1553 domain-containing protein [Pirellulales bacterium]
MLRRFSPLSTVVPALVGALAVLCAQAVADEPYGRFQFDESDREHWSFVLPKRPAVPAVKNSAWVKNPIDAFVLVRLEDEKIEPNPPADRLTLLRRVYLDLIGLLPTPAEQDAFLADDSPEALSRVVDDLLARPEYGERWGRHWLDVVRYAESNGYERDGAKPSAWRYRDYVIEAFNADKPFDRFLTEQLAGDELADANAETCIATTFLRLGPWDDEPADAVVDRYDQLDDVLGTTVSTFMALSLRCARCHDHKFEQFTQRDYTRMLAIFEPLKRPQEGRTDLDRMVGTAAELTAYQAATKAIDEQMASLGGERDRAEWALSKRLASAGMLRTPEMHAVAATSREQPQAWRYTEEKPPEGWEQSNFDARTWKEGPGGFGDEGTPGAVVRTPWKSNDIWLRREFEITAEALASLDRARLRFLVHHDDACEVYINGVLAAMVAGFTVDYKTQPIYGDGVAALVPGKNVLAVHCSQTTGGQYIDVGLVAVEALPTATGGADIDALVLPADAAEAFLVDPAARNAKQHEMVKKFRPKLKQLLERCGDDREKQSFEELERRLGEADKARPTALPSAYIWFEESNQAGPSHVWRRGNPRDSIEEVGAGFPAILVDSPPPPATPTAKSTGRRAQLAAWLASADHPLTSRVLVNRLWQHHFGDGIVGSENDFGVMGEMPTHPELLDWLASELVAGGWRLKPLHRLIVLSNTYQMSSATRPEIAARDPADDLLWRYPPRRLEAEAVRDCVLATAGTLNRDRGGPSVYPMISPEVMATQSKPGNGWGKSKASEAARRSVYVFVKRTLLVPELEVLDFPDTNGSCEQRVVSTVAPQALTWFNGAFIREQAQALAARLAREAGDDDRARVDLAYRLAMARPASDAERDAVLGFLARQTRRIAAENQQAKEPVDARQRALTDFCLVLLNGNEFVYVR